VIVDRAKVLIVHGVTAEEWCERYDLEPHTRPCQRCGESRATSLPFAQGNLRGLIAPTCAACQHFGTPYCVVHKDPDSGLADLFGGGR
jgi:hypothetical protein